MQDRVHSDPGHPRTALSHRHQSGKETVSQGYPTTRPVILHYAVEHPAAHYEQHPQEKYEIFVRFVAHTVADPRAVVVESKGREL